MKPPIKLLTYATVLIATLLPAPTWASGTARTAGTEAELVSAITAANATSSDTITLTADITLTATLPDITSTMSFLGGGFAIDGDGITRVFLVNSGTVNFSNMTIRNGYAKGGDGEDSENGGGGGGGGGMGGAIFVNTGATVSVSNMTFEGNQAVGGNGGDGGVTGAAAGQNGGQGGAGPFGPGGAGGTSGAQSGVAGGSFGAGSGGGWGTSTAMTTGGSGADSAFGAGAGGGGGGGLNAAGNGYQGGAKGTASWGSETFQIDVPRLSSGTSGATGNYEDEDAFFNPIDILFPNFPPGIGGSGGGGAGLGGAIFVRSGATLNINTCHFAANAAIGGEPGDITGGENGPGLGGAIFAMDTATVRADLITFGVVGNEANSITSRSVRHDGPSSPSPQYFDFGVELSNNHVYGRVDRLTALPAPTNNGGDNDAPVLTTTGVPNLDLGVRNANFLIGGMYTEVEEIIDRLHSPGITDADADTPGIAIINADDANGLWLYSLGDVDADNHLIFTNFSPGLVQAVEEQAVILSAGRSEIVGGAAHRNHQGVVAYAALGNDFVTVLVMERGNDHFPGVAVEATHPPKLELVVMLARVGTVVDFVGAGIQ